MANCGSASVSTEYDTSPVVLSARIESFSYPHAEEPVLSSVMLDFHAGEFVALTGPSGSGKSTLAMVLAGLMPQRIAGNFSGSVWFKHPKDGAVDISKRPLHHVSQDIGIVFQNPEYQLIQYQVDTEVAFGPENLGLPHHEVVARTERALDLTGATDLASCAISTLSGGQKQRVALAAALAMGPTVLILDEPTSDLDPNGTEEVLAVLQRLAHELGHTIVLVEHKLDEIAPVVDRVILMENGTVTLNAPPVIAFSRSGPWHRAGLKPPDLSTLCERLDLPISFTTTEVLTHLGEVQLRSDHTTEQSSANTATEGHHRSTVQPTTPVAFEAQNLTISFKDKVVINDLTLKVRAGEWVALIGANGSGKTTLGAAMMGFLPIASGQLMCFGQQVNTKKIAQQASRVGYLFQNVDDMLFCDTVDDELLFRERHALSRSDAKMSQPTEIMELIGLTHRSTHHPYALSGGERQRLGLGALMTRAPLGLILDEPTTGQDEVHTLALFELLERLRRQSNQLTCLLITHDMRLVARFTDRVLALKDGSVVVDAPPRQAFAQPALLATCGVKVPALADLSNTLGAPYRSADEVITDLDELSALLSAHILTEAMQ